MTDASADLSGSWNGSYAYPGELDPVAFRIELRDSGGALSGLCTEDGAGLSRDGPSSATLSGHRTPTSVSFVKIYDSHDQLLAPVVYDGVIGDDGHEVGGEWHIAGEWSGPFVMTRPRAKTEEAEAMIAETIDVPPA